MVAKALPLIFVLLACACTAPLERQQVPIYTLMRVDDATPGLAMDANVQAMEAWGITRLIIDIPLELNYSDSTPMLGTPVMQSLDTVLSSCVRLGIDTIGISFTTLSHNRLFPEGQISDSGVWLSAFCRLADSVKSRLGKVHVSRVLIGSDWIAAEDAGLVPLLLDSLRIRWQVPVSYQIDLRRVSETDIWKTSDEVALNAFFSPNPDSIRRDARIWNRKAGDTIAGSGKPVFIAQSNLLDIEKLLCFKNHLRFWPKEVIMNGIVLNSMYNRVPMADSTTYFGIAGDEELKQWILDYQE